MRALGVNLPGLSRKSIDRRPQPPGQHGAARKGKMSDHKRQLMEKQKLRFNYGISEKHFRILFTEARKSAMATGDKLLELLERRLDNVVFRAGYAPTIPAARQLIAHAHLTVNGRKVDISSFRVKPGDVIRIRERSASMVCIETSLAAPALERPSWLEFNANDKSARITDMPTGSSVPFEVDVMQVVEFFSKRV
jgi:small subunit ribosomal protein S4